MSTTTRAAGQPRRSIFRDRRLLARASVALAHANIRYWPRVAPLVADQLESWERRALEIEAPAIKALALDKLHRERFNSEVAATLATFVPERHRKTVVEAIVAYEVMYDYLDGLTERPAPDPLARGRALYRAFTDAVTPGPIAAGRCYGSQLDDDGGYLRQLVDTVRRALARLPSTAAVAPAAAQAAARCAEAQVRAHAVPTIGALQLERWAAQAARGTPLGWREYLAGAASSVLAVHALIGAAAERRATPEHASRLDATYLSICALCTMLDSLVDYERDTRAGQTAYIRCYRDQRQLAGELAGAARRAVAHARPLPHGEHHVMTLVGVVAYYISAPTATRDIARPVAEQLRRELEPLITPTLLVMRTWRTTKRARERLRRERPQSLVSAGVRCMEQFHSTPKTDIDYLNDQAHNPHTVEHQLLGAFEDATAGDSHG